MEPLLLGIDVGTSSVKAALLDSKAPLTGGQAEYPLHHIRPAWVEQYPEDWGLARAKPSVRRWPKFREAPRGLGLAVSCQAPLCWPWAATAGRCGRR